jgi:RNA polymerase sigma factor (sigma-70 family)
MSTASGPTVEDRDLLATARRGDEDAYRRLVELYQGELHAHSYRMLGSVHDAEDALQEALLRAWRGLPRFQERSSFRSWLYRIASGCRTRANRPPCAPWATSASRSSPATTWRRWSRTTWRRWSGC